MSYTKKSVFSATGVVVAVGVVIGGMMARQEADLGMMHPTSSDTSIDRLLASRNDDINVPAGDYFYELSQKLKKEYVEPVSDDEKLATGAIRGMIASLQDPESLFMDKAQFGAFLNSREGKFEGIGADLQLVTASKEAPAKPSGESADGNNGASAEEALVTTRDIPRLEVVSVVPGGPADRAEVKPGDWVSSVDGHWVVNSEIIHKFRAAVKAVNAKKMPLSELNLLRTEIRSKADHAIMPLRAKELLFMGKTGTVTVAWNRGSAQRTTKIKKAESTMAGFGVRNGAIDLPFVPGSDKQLRNAIAGKSEITIDLRHNTLGDLTSMRQCLEVLAPKGQYGGFATLRHDTPTPLVVTQGNPSPPKITLITDRSTRGVAEMFALALSSKGHATITGGSMGGDRNRRTIVRLPDGSGYTLVTSIYKPMLSSTQVAHKGGAR